MLLPQLAPRDPTLDSNTTVLGALWFVFDCGIGEDDAAAVEHVGVKRPRTPVESDGKEDLALQCHRQALAVQALVDKSARLATQLETARETIELLEVRVRDAEAQQQELQDRVEAATEQNDATQQMLILVERDATDSATVCGRLEVERRRLEAELGDALKKLDVLERKHSALVDTMVSALQSDRQVSSGS